MDLENRIKVLEEELISITRRLRDNTRQAQNNYEDIEVIFKYLQMKNPGDFTSDGKVRIK